MRVPPEEFEQLVARALDALPEEYAEMLENVAVVVEEEPDDELLADMEMEPDEELFGFYHGVSLTVRESGYSALPDRISIYRGPLLRYCRNRREVMREVRDTVVHELGHHFGLDEDDMPY
jgi:predicted Zn-dependent protease with MMP-like domain